MIRHQLSLILTEDVPRGLLIGVLVFVAVYTCSKARGEEPPSVKGYVHSEDTPPPVKGYVFPQKNATELVTTEGRIIVLGSDGVWRYKSTVSLRQPSATVGGCGCTASRNCGASFCKSRGGTGCPQSCPVK